MNNELVLLKAKGKLVRSIIFTTIVTTLVIILVYIKNVSLVFALIFELFLIFDVLSSNYSYSLVKKVIELSKDNYNNIIFSNNKNCIFTDNFICIREKVKIKFYEYKEIRKVYKRICYTRKGMPDILYIFLKDGTTYQIYIYDNAFLDTSIENLEEFLINKNKKILVDETIVDFGICKL